MTGLALSGLASGVDTSIVDQLMARERRSVTRLQYRQSAAGGRQSALEGTYVFCVRHLMEARLERDAGKIDKVAELLSELRDSSVEIAAAA